MNQNDLSKVSFFFFTQAEEQSDLCGGYSQGTKWAYTGLLCSSLSQVFLIIADFFFTFSKVVLSLWQQYFIYNYNYTHSL